MSTVPRSPRAVHIHIRALAAALILGTALPCLEAAVASAEPSAEELQDQLETASQELEVIVEDYNRVAQDLEDLEAHHDEVGDSIGPLKARAEEAADELGDIANALYQAGHPVTVTPLLTGTPDTLADRISILEYLSADQETWHTELTRTHRILESEEIQIEDLAAQRTALKAEKADKEAEIAEAVAELDVVRAQAIGAGYRGSPMLTAPAIPGGDAGAAAAAVRFANGALGAPYQWGGSGPGGYDCSGLTSAAWGAAGVNLPHNSQSQYNAVARVGRDELQPGDLVFYYDDLHHVALYAGEGKIIHAPTEGQSVRVSAIDEMPVAGYGRPA